MKRSFAELGGGGGGGKSGGLTKYFKKAASNNATTPNTSELTLAEPTEEEKASLEHTSMHASWYELLRGEFQKDYFLKVRVLEGLERKNGYLVEGIFKGTAGIRENNLSSK